MDLRGRRRGRLWLTRRLVLRPLQRHTRAALRPQDVLGALQARVALTEQLLVRVPGQAVLHAVPLPPRHRDVPGQRLSGNKAFITEDLRSYARQG